MLNSWFAVSLHVAGNVSYRRRLDPINILKYLINFHNTIDHDVKCKPSMWRILWADLRVLNCIMRLLIASKVGRLKLDQVLKVKHSLSKYIVYYWFDFGLISILLFCFVRMRPFRMRPGLVAFIIIR